VNRVEGGLNCEGVERDHKQLRRIIRVFKGEDGRKVEIGVLKK